MIIFIIFITLITIQFQCLDTRNLVIKKVSVNGLEAKHKTLDDVPYLGQPLQIEVPEKYVLFGMWLG